jgi:hypothetical protein
VLSVTVAVVAGDQVASGSVYVPRAEVAWRGFVPKRACGCVLAVVKVFRYLWGATSVGDLAVTLYCVEGGETVLVAGCTIAGSGFDCSKTSSVSEKTDVVGILAVT